MLLQAVHLSIQMPEGIAQMDALKDAMSRKIDSSSTMLTSQGYDSGLAEHTRICVGIINSDYGTYVSVFYY